MSNELYHYGVKGMKWKDHKYTSVKGGKYIYDIARYNITRQGQEDRQMAKSLKAQRDQYIQQAYWDKQSFREGVLAKDKSKIENSLASYKDNKDKIKLTSHDAAIYERRYKKYSIKGITESRIEKGKRRLNLKKMTRAQKKKENQGYRRYKKLPSNTKKMNKKEYVNYIYGR